MRQYAELLALRHDSARTRRSYYRAMRLVHEHFGVDPSTLGEDHFRDYILQLRGHCSLGVRACVHFHICTDPSAAYCKRPR